MVKDLNTDLIVKVNYAICKCHAKYLDKKVSTKEEAPKEKENENKDIE